MNYWKVAAAGLAVLAPMIAMSASTYSPIAYGSYRLYGFFDAPTADESIGQIGLVIARNPDMAIMLIGPSTVEETALAASGQLKRCKIAPEATQKALDNPKSGSDWLC